MMFILKYLLAGVIFIVFFEITKDKTSPQVQLTNFDRFWGVLIWPLMLITFVGALIYFFTKNMKDED